MILTGVAAVIASYFIGSIPAAYITTRLYTGKDIRKVGSGNAGAYNVYRNVGMFAAALTAMFDIGKGVVAVWLAQRLLDYPPMNEFGESQAYIWAAALAVVVGHVWSVFLKFSGGNGIAPALGVLGVLMPLELLWASALAVVAIVITRNFIFSINIGLAVALPLFAWLGFKPAHYFWFLLILALMLVVHFMPTARAAIVKAGSIERLFVELFRLQKPDNKLIGIKKSSARKAEDS